MGSGGPNLTTITNYINKDHPLLYAGVSRPELAGWLSAVLNTTSGYKLRTVYYVE